MIEEWSESEDLSEDQIDSLGHYHRVIHPGDDGTILKYVRSLPYVGSEDEVCIPSSVPEEVLSFLLSKYSVARHSNRDTRTGYSYEVFPHSVVLSPDVERSIYRLGLNAPCLEPTRVGSNRTVFKTTNSREPPRIIADIPLILAYVDMQRRDRSFLPLCYGTMFGVPVNMVKGHDEIAYIRASEQFRRIPYSIRYPPSKIQHVMDQVFSRLGFVSDERGPLAVPRRQEIVTKMLTYHASAGNTCHMASTYPRIEVPVTKYESVILNEAKTGSKAGFAEQIASFAMEIVEVLQRCEDPAEIPEELFMRFPWIIESKQEYITLCDLFDDAYQTMQDLQTMDTASERFQHIHAKVQKADNKLRLFWNGSMYNFVISLLISSGFMSQLYGYQCAIGVSYTYGEWNSLFFQLKCDPELEPDSERAFKLDELYTHYPELRERFYFDLDWSKFDMTQNYLVLRMLATFVISIYESSDDPKFMDEIMLTHLAAYNGSAFAFKYIVAPQLKGEYFCSGAVPSGALLTSAGDSFIGMVIFQAYINECTERASKAYSAEKFEMFLLARVYDLFMVWIYGDDLVGGCPKVFEDVFSPRDFIDFVEENFNLVCKEYGVYEFLFTEINYTLKPNGIWEEEYLVRGDRERQICFLKNYPSKIYHTVDGLTRFVGYFNHRTTQSIVAKLSSPNSAGDHIIKWLCSLVSMGHLAVGNTYAYQLVEQVYGEVVRRIESTGVNVRKSLSDFLLDVRKDLSLIADMPHSMRRLFIDGNMKGVFPGLSAMRSKQKVGAIFRPKYLGSWDFKNDVKRDAPLFSRIADLDDAFEKIAFMYDFYGCAR